MERQQNNLGVFYTGATHETPFSDGDFVEVHAIDGDQQFALHTNIGSLTVLDRLTGFGWRDIETGFRDKNGKFWLASGGFDVRQSGCKTIGEAIQWVKDRANTCVES
jgi:hypothetical protein